LKPGGKLIRSRSDQSLRLFCFLDCHKQDQQRDESFPHLVTTGHQTTHTVLLALLSLNFNKSALLQEQKRRDSGRMAQTDFRCNAANAVNFCQEIFSKK
jgi:hypothetical protein